MRASLTFQESFLYNWNPFVKAYVILFVLFIAAFFSTTMVLYVTSLLSILILIGSHVSLKMILREIKLYIAWLIPFLIFLAWLEYGELSTYVIKQFAIIYLRFLNIIVLGAIYMLTTNPSHLALILLRHKRLKNIGITLFGGFGAFLFFDHKVRNIIALQGLRGAKLSLNPFSLKKTLKALEALLIPVYLMSLDLAQDLTLAILTRGYDPNRLIEIPPHLRLQSRDMAIVASATAFLLLSLYLPLTHA